MEHLTLSFMRFKAILGLKINLEKSELIPVLGELTKCGRASWHFVLLGEFPPPCLFGPSIRSKVSPQGLDAVEEKFQKRCYIEESIYQKEED